jgi:TetR/AcrR family transcriptional repressor of nem operon
MRDLGTRDKILDIASRLIRTGGYEALNFGTIAEELGITRANIHHHFKNKENLALQAVNRYVVGLEERFAAFEEKHPGNFPAAMAAVHDGMWDRLSETNYGGFCVAVQLISDRSWIPEEVGHEATGYYERLLSIFTELIEESQEAGTVRKDRPAEDIAHEALSIHLGVGLMAMTLPAERRPGSYSRRRMREWLATIAPEREAVSV